MKNRLEFGKMYQKYNFLGKGVEVGVKKGHNILNIISSGWQGSIIAVDIWDNREDFEEAQRNLAPFKVNMLKGGSVEMAQTFPDESIDWVYIDANHTYNSVMDDLKAWYPKVRKGGIVSGHDYLDGTHNGYLGQVYGVKSAVDEFTKDLGKKVKVTTNDTFENLHFDSWWFIK